MNQRNRSDIEISQTNFLISSSSRIEPKTYRLCVSNLVKKVNFDTFLSVTSPLLCAPLK